MHDDVRALHGLGEGIPVKYVTAHDCGTIINPGLADPSRVYEVWSGDFDYLCHKLGAGVYTLTMHPQVIGRGHRLLMLEKLIVHMRESNVNFTTMGEFVQKWRAGNPFGERKVETQHA